MSDTWPVNVEEVLVEELAEMEGIQATINRPLTEEDASHAIGVYVLSWGAPDDAYMIGQPDPVLNVYSFAIDLIVKGMDRALIHAEMATLTKRLRTMLYLDDDIQVRLNQLSEVSFGRTESYKRMRVTRQDYRTGSLGGMSLAASTTTITVETDSR